MQGNSTGFTLIEVMMAMAILLIGIMVWMVAQNSNLKGRSTSSKITRSTQLAQSQLDELSALAAGRLQSAGSYTQNSTAILEGVTYNLLGTLQVTTLSSDSKSCWLAQSQVQWSQYGNHTLTLERMVIGK